VPPRRTKKLMLQVNRTAPALVDLSRVVTAHLRAARGDSGPVCAAVSCAEVAAPGPCPGGGDRMEWSRPATQGVWWRAEGTNSALA
jgi:hypothetical protein